MVTIRAMLWTYEKPESGQYPVKIVITKDRKRQYLHLGFAVSVKQWDDGNQVVIKHPNALDYNDVILKTKTALQALAARGETINVKNPTPQVQQILPATTTQKLPAVTTQTLPAVAATGDVNSFYYWFQKRIDYSKEKHALQTGTKLETVLADMKDFAPTLNISEFTFDFLREFETHLIKRDTRREKEGTGKKLHHNTVADKLVRIRIICNELMRTKIAGPDGKKIPVLPFEDNPFKQGFKITFKKVNRKRLNKTQVKSLQSLIIPDKTHNKKHDSVKLAVDMYDFSLNCGGIRWGDTCRLKVKDVSYCTWIDDQNVEVTGYRLVYKMGKTEVMRDIELNARAFRIYERNAAIAKKLKSPYLFHTKFNPAQDDTKAEERKESKSIDARGSFFRKKLKVACNWAKVPAITPHTTRHSVADFMMEAGLGDALQGVLGHQRGSTTEIYKKTHYGKRSDAALKAVTFDFVDEVQKTG